MGRDNFQLKSKRKKIFMNYIYGEKKHTLISIYLWLFDFMNGSETLANDNLPIYIAHTFGHNATAVICVLLFVCFAVKKKTKGTCL